MAIRFLDMFAGIGGFRSGLEDVGGFECIGHCEIDKHANMAYCAIYNTEGEYADHIVRWFCAKQFVCGYLVKGTRKPHGHVRLCIPKQE